MAEFPALPLFTDAFIADTIHLNAQQTGAYLMLLMAAWRSPDCKLPDDDKFLARAARMSGQAWAKNKDMIMSFWSKDETQKWYQRRLTDERSYADTVKHKNSIAGKASALKNKERHSTSVQPKPNVNPTPTPTPTIEIERETPPTPVSKNFILPDWVPKTEWDAWIEVRKRTPGADNSQTTLDQCVAALMMLEARGHDPTEVLREATLGGWKTLHPPSSSKQKFQPSRGNNDQHRPAKFNPATAAIEYARSLEQGETSFAG